jgi:lipopolysaccharide transport system permease protein
MNGAVKTVVSRICAPRPRPPRARTTKLVIEPGMTVKNYWRDLWNYRELIYFLAWRDVAVRYKQTWIGVAWALIRPASTMLVFVGFRRLAGFPHGSIPDPILVFAAVLPWQFFSSALSDSTASLLGNANLISKVYFPRLLLPLAAVATTLIDFAITLMFLFVLMLWDQFLPGWQLAALPLFVLLAFGLALGFGLLFAALNVEYRDFRFIVPFIVQFGLFVSPIAFSTEDVPERWRAIYSLNPMVGVIDGCRWSLLGGRVDLNVPSICISAVLMVAVVALGVWYFRRMESTFADFI